MSPKPAVEVILGAGTIGADPFPDATSTKGYINLFQSYNHTRIDTARAYPPPPFPTGTSESLLAEAGATRWATIDTKLTATIPKAYSAENVAKGIQEAKGALKGGEIDVLYLHGPVLDVPFEETLEALNTAYKEGKFKSFGISNYSPQHVEEFVRIAEEKGWVKPSVYQGPYNAIARKGEKDLFPVLRKHSIAFRAYSPSAAGIFSGKVTAESINDPKSRWSNTWFVGKLYSSQYLKEELLEVANTVHAAALKQGTNGHAVALRWAMYHSALKAEYGDGVIIGARDVEQLKQNLEYFEQGPLSDDLVELFEDVWTKAEPIAPVAYIDPNGKAMAMIKAAHPNK